MDEDLDAALSALEDASDETETVEEVELAADESTAEQTEQTEQADKPEQAPLPVEEYKKRNLDLQAAMREERRKRQELERTYEERFQEVTRRLQGGQQQQPQPQSNVLPDDLDVTGNPLEALEKLAGVVKGYQKTVQEERAERERQEYQAQQEQILADTVREAEAEFKQEFPDYPQALEHYLGARHAMLSAGPYTPEQVTNALRFEMMQLSAAALQQGKNPASTIYAAAKAIGYGYKPPVDKAAEQVARIAAGTKAGSKMAGGGAGAGDGMTFKQLATLKGAAFDKAMEKFLSS